MQQTFLLPDNLNTYKIQDIQDNLYVLTFITIHIMYYFVIIIVPVKLPSGVKLINKNDYQL